MDHRSKARGFHATLVAGLVLVIAGCTMPNQQASNSPAVTPSEVASPSPTPSTSPSPIESPTPESSPTPRPSPSPAKLIISTLPFHLGELGVPYAAVTLVAKGGVPPYKWSLEGGALPPGVVLSTSGKATGTPTTLGNFPFVVRVDDSAGAAAGAPTSIRVFRRIVFGQTSAVCGNSPDNCAAGLSGALLIPYTGGAGGKPVVKVTSVTGGTIDKTTDGCATSTPTATSAPPPGMTVSASSGVMTLSAGPPDRKTWCFYAATITFVLIDPSPCGAGLLCVTSNTLTVRFSL